MFGAFRLVLALMVVHWHLTEFGYSGQIAVFGFFCLSGYLMTRIVNETYNDGLSGFGRYLANRALRIYPAYYVALALGIAWLLFRVGPGIVPWSAAVPNLTLIFADRSDLLLGQTWSLHIELLHYIAIGAFLGRSRTIAVVWLVFSIELPIAAMVFTDMPAELFYFHPIGATAPFAVGSVIWHFRNRFTVGPRVGTAAAGAFVLAGVAVDRGFLPREIEFFAVLYGTLPLVALVVAWLMKLPSRAWDSWLGDLAYPVFLLHIIAISAARYVIGDNGMLVAFVSIAATLALSWLVVVTVDRPVQRLRSAIRRPVPAYLSAT